MTITHPGRDPDPIPRSKHDPALFRWCIALFAVAFAVRVLLMVVTRSYLKTEMYEVERVARSLATQGTFADAYGDGMGPTAHSAPLYPLLLSLIFRVVGCDWPGTLGQELLSCSLASLQYALLPLVARACGMPVFAGVLGGLLAALVPANRWVQTKGSFEYSLSALLMVLFTLAVLRAWNDRGFSRSRGVLLGVLTGLIMLTAPHAGLLFAGVAITTVALFFRSVPFPQLVTFVAIQAAISAAMLIPWAARNQAMLGAPIWSRSNPGMELALSNNDMASAVWEENMENGLFARMHPFSSSVHRDRIREVGEAQYNRERMQEATRWISDHPSKFIGLTIRRAGLFWFPIAARRSQTIALAAITLAGLAGFACFVTGRGRPSTGTSSDRADARSPGQIPADGIRGGAQTSASATSARALVAVFFLTLWIVFPLSSYAFQMSVRPRYSIEWSLFLFAGHLAYLGFRAAVPTHDTATDPT